ncbi:ATP-binding cassette domain-containing protein [Ekhidna sp.]|uniref:ATP-binding cassette domain-containing protein n=1 Tax=Ekhidna sp. TaxID=2608089 RepID=UPI003BAB43D3
MSILKLHNIQKTYADNRIAFRCDDFELDEGSRIGIAGETGSGKSTLLKIIAGLEKPDSGDALLNGEEIYPKLDRLIAGHPEIAYLSQSFELPKFISVNEYLSVHPYTVEDVNQIAKLCQIANLLEKNTKALSGGERQRVALAKVLLRKPTILLLDEPFSNLDPHHKRIIKQVINQIEKEIETTIMMVSHEPTDLLPWADKIMVLKDGKILQEGTPRQIYFQPRNEHIAGLFGSFQKLDNSQWGDMNKTIVRPEQFQLNDHGVKGEVVSIHFVGNNEELVIKTIKEEIVVKSEVGRYEVGDEVKVSLKSIDF